MRYEFRPLAWTGPVTSHGRRKAGQFKASYPITLDLLFREAEKLGCKHLVLQVDIAERDIRVDGLPKANARYGSNPGVIVSFESRHGPLRYATDAYLDWRDNLRAIALSLEALRAVDRYGVTKIGEQYTGFRALPPAINDRLEPGLVAIPLRDRDGRIVSEAIIDVEDHALAGKPWYRLASGYVVRTEQRDGRKIMVYLHREVIGLGPYSENRIQVDHQNGNKLDNRRSNLRAAVPQENAQNRGANAGRHWARGVSFRRETGKWRAVAKLDGISHELGVFDAPEDAAETVARWRAEHMPFSEDARAAANGSRPFATADEALQWMRAQLGVGGGAPGTLYRELAKHLHPDKGGDPAGWDKLDAARNLLVTAGLL